MKLNGILQRIRDNDPTLTTISLYGLYSNQIGATGAQALAEALKTNQTVTTINLGSNKIGAAGAQALAEALKTNKTVTAIDLYYNQIGVAGAQALAEALKTNKTVTTINLNRNQIGAAGVQALAEALKTNKTVTTIKLCVNQIGAVGAQALAEALKTNKTVTTINLGGNEIGSVGAQALAKALKINKTVTTIDLRLSQISAEVEELIIGYIERNKAEAKAKAKLEAQTVAEKAKAEAEAKAKAELVAQARQAILEHFQCPITTQLMYEPVLAADGESYEKEVIEAWLTSRNTSPLTNEVLAHQHLTPNKNIKRAINELLDKYPVLRETGDYYLAKSLIQQAINAIERCDAKELEKLLNSHFGLVTDNLHKVIPKPKAASSSSSSSCSEPVEEAESIQPDPTPVYLLNVIAEKGDAACLNVTIKRMGAAFKELVLKQTQNNPDGLLQLLAKRQESAAIDILTVALGYTSDDYLRLMRSALSSEEVRGLWFDCYLKAHQESPEVVLAKMLTEVSASEAVATLKMTAIRLDAAVLYSLAARCIKEGLLAELQTLATLGLSLQTVDAKGNNLLHLAAEHNQKEIALWLLANGCSEKAVNSEGQRPRQVAAANQHYDLSDSLIRQHQAQKFSFFVQPLQAKVEELQQSLVLSQAQSQAKIAELENSLALSQSKLFKLENSMLAASERGVVKESDELQVSLINPTASMSLGPK